MTPQELEQGYYWVKESDNSNWSIMYYEKNTFWSIDNPFCVDASSLFKLDKNKIQNPDYASARLQTAIGALEDAKTIISNALIELKQQ